ncbi:hypothetical protein [Idiomarina loihiensis]|uniref:hypothetical protein n=1 Tax=Idiomarina loihiensis TaxID=135577 RepID=UPI00384F83DB
MFRIMILFVAFSAFFSFSAIAEKVYPIILIHGFQSHQLQSQPNAKQVELDGAAYWSGVWKEKAAARIDWPSHQRVQGKISTDYVWPKLRKFSREGLCDAGCILVTHSTGDLIARYILENQRNWLKNAGMTPLNIVATVDFAGAGGGTELADIAINVANGGGLTNEAMRYAMSLWLGMPPSEETLGVLNDLRVANARQLAPLPEARVPRLRFVGDANDFWNATAMFLPGHDDGVVAAHSACGALNAGNFSSCSTAMEFSGRKAPVSQGVAHFMAYHYPVAMGAEYSHSATINRQFKGALGSVQRSQMFKNGYLLKIVTDKESNWLGQEYEYMRGSQRASMSMVALELLR